MLRLRQGRLPPAYWVSRLYFCSLPYIKYKSKKTSSNRRRFGEVENRSRSLRFNCFHINSLCEESLPASAEGIATRGSFSGFCPGSHSFHNHPTVRRQKDWPEEWKTSGSLHLRAQLLGQFVKQPVQILVVLANPFNLVHRMQDCRMVLAAKLASNLRQGRFREVLGQVHRNLPRID